MTTPFERLKSYSSSPYTALYKAIITQAIIDATNISNDREAKKIEYEAKNWIFGNSKEFYLTCLDADVEATLVRKITKELITLHKSRSDRRRSNYYSRKLTKLHSTPKYTNRIFG